MLLIKSVSHVSFLLTDSSTAIILISGLLIPTNTTFCTYQYIQGKCGCDGIFVPSQIASLSQILE